MKLSSLRIVTKDVPALAEFYEKLTGVDPVGNADFVEFRFPGITPLALCSHRSVEMSNAGAASPAANRSTERKRCQEPIIRPVAEKVSGTDYSPVNGS